MAAAAENTVKALILLLAGLLNIKLVLVAQAQLPIILLVLMVRIRGSTAPHSPRQDKQSAQNMESAVDPIARRAAPAAQVDIRLVRARLTSTAALVLYSPAQVAVAVAVQAHSVLVGPVAQVRMPGQQLAVAVAAVTAAALRVKIMSVVLLAVTAAITMPERATA